MRKIKYPLIVSDFDGTLARKDGGIGEKTRRAIDEYVANGGIFAISTGRMPSGILPHAKSLGLKGFLCCGQGSVIINLDNGETIMQAPLSNSQSVAICKKMEEMGLHTHAYGLFDYYCNMDDDALKMYEEAIGIKAKCILDKPLWKYIEETGLESFKLLAMVNPEDSPKIIKELEDAHFENCIVTKSARFLVEICNANYSKGTSVKFLAQEYNIPLERTIAIGDQWNDLSMLQTAGLGIAVANAQPELKAVAKEIPYTNNEDAVGYVIEKYAYAEEEA